MANDDFNEEDDDNTTSEEVGPKALRERLRRLEAENKELQDLKVDNERLQQKDQLREAGLNLTDKQIKALNAAHEGESNPDAWKQTAIDLGFSQAQPDTTTAEQNAHEQIANASDGATTKTELSAKDAYAQANSPAEVLAIARERGSVVAQDLQ